MYGRLEGELWFHRWHMWPVPSSSTPSVAAPSNSFVFIDTNSFSKDGRKIHVGDCALFKPSHNSLPFVGIIRRLIVGKDNNLNLSVNWLYRPADVKLEKGAQLEAAPNEVFYSFHKDEIPAASLLHPCKITFLRKGVELPSGLSSFVCRRVYDIENKRLWWLTDQDYINSYLTQERQEEVDQLLDKTRIEMYGAVQTGGRSPKPLNGPNGTTQLKPSSDNVQNSSSSISSHAKSKKREHGAHNSDSVKRERLSKVDDADSGQLRSEHTIKNEISKITDKGGLVDFGGVEKLIQLMRPEKKLDLGSRTLLVDVISVTERFDCLGRFVQLRGLSVLDEWLQEIHKGKIGDGSPKENDKSIEEFLFCLLRALDRLPVNLHALQTCNVGKSVNHLRSHKNSEIQKKARSLVSTWKRRVEAEMNIIETKSSTSRGGSWPNKSMMSEVSPMGSRRVGASSEVGPKSSTSQPSGPKAVKNNNSGETAAKSPLSPAKSLAATSDLPSSAAKEGRSCSSSQSPNNSQSCSSDHGKTRTGGASCRESAGGSSSISKISSGVSHSRNSSNGFHGSTTIPKEGNLVKLGSVDNGNSPRLIVRLPNSSTRSPARTVSEESPEDTPTISGKASLPEPSEKQDHLDNQKVSEGKSDTNLSHEVKVSGGSSSGVTPKPGKLYERSYSSINALVESCAKFSEASVSPSAGDDGGMNLLASVAAGEISENNSPLPEDSCSANVAKLRREDNTGHVTAEQISSVESLSAKGGPTQENVPVMAHVSGDSKDASFGCELKKGEDNAAVMAPEVKADATTNGCKEDDDDEGQRKLLTCHQSTSFNFSNMKQSPSSDEDKNVEKKTVLSDGNLTQVNEESASWSSSDMHVDEKKLVNKQIKATTSCGGDVDLAPKSEERQNMDPGTSVSQQNAEQVSENDETDKLRPSEKATEVVAEMAVKLDFDLNEVLPSDDGEVTVNGNRSALITVAAAAKGPFCSSENLSRGKTELGWKGSAATSAFRPAEPRKTSDVSVPDNHKPGRPLLDFDLNVGVVDDNANRLDLDLNACEESSEVVQLSVFRPGIEQLGPRSLQARGFSNAEPSSSRGFDLNNGPSVEEAGGLAGGESVPFSKNGMQFMPGVPNVRMNNMNMSMDMGNFSSWFPPNNSYPALTIPYPVAPAAVSQRMLTPATVGPSVNPELFRGGPVLPSSPAVAFPSTVPFQYSAFPFETNFSMPTISNTFSSVSTGYVDPCTSGGPICFPSIPSQAQLVGPNGVVSMPYRPYFMSLAGAGAGGSSNVGPDGRKWVSQGGLDLNAGPGGGTDDKLPPGMRQISSLASSQGLADEQLKMFQQMAAAAGGGMPKRKEPDVGWEHGGDRINYKKPSWQ